MKKKDAVLVVTAGAAGLYWWRCSRLPKLIIKYTAAGIEYIFSAFGNRITGTRPPNAEGIEAYPKGGYNFVIESATEGIIFTLYDAAGKSLYSRVVSRTPATVAGMTCNAAYAL